MDDGLIKLDVCLKKTVKNMEYSLREIEKAFSEIRKLKTYKCAQKMEVKKVEQQLEFAFA